MGKQVDSSYLLSESEHQRYEDKLTNEEKRVVSLVEERGVYGFKYANIIDKICDYLNQCLHINTPTEHYLYVNGNFQCKADRYIINVPASVTKGIDIFEELTISATISNLITNDSIEDTLYGSGSGIYTIKRYDKLTNAGKLPTSDIKLTGYAINGKIVSHTIVTSLYHEINHAADNYNRLKKYKNANLFDEYEKMDFDTVFRLSQSTDELDKALGTILYRLFVNSEKNALITSVYTDLKSMQSLRSNFVRDITKTKAYIVYEQIKNTYLPKLNKLTDNDIEKYVRLLKLPTSVLNKNNFLDSIKRKTNFLLGDFLKRIGKTATLYYDENEEKRDANNLIKKKYRTNSFNI